MDNQQTQSLQAKTDYTTDNPKAQSPQANEGSSTSGLGGIGDKLSSSVTTGGAQGSGDSQSLLDKGISYLQESITGKSGQAKETSSQGDTSHHAVVDEAHPEMISEFLRDQHGSMTKGSGKWSDVVGNIGVEASEKASRDTVLLESR